MKFNLQKILNFNYESYQNILFALFILSGAIKFIFIFYNFPIDITTLITGLIVVDFIYNLPKIFKNLPVNVFFIIVYLALFGISVISLIYSPSESYKFVKVFSFVLSGIGFLYPLAIREFKENVFFKTLLGIAIPASLAFFIAKNIYWYGLGVSNDIRVKYSEFGGSYLLLSDCIALGILYLIKNKKYIISLLLMVSIFALGAKGPLFFLIIIILYWKRKKIIYLKIRKKIVNGILIGVLTFTPLLLYFNDKFLSIFKIGLYRFSEIFSPVQEEGHHSRFEYFSFAIEGVFDSVFSILFGHGIGSFGYLFNGIDEKDFPHNIFLEAWFEIGVFGLLAVIILLIFPLFIKHRNLLFKLCAIYMLLNYLKSGTLDGARVLFAIYAGLLFINIKRDS